MKYALLFLAFLLAASPLTAEAFDTSSNSGYSTDEPYVRITKVTEDYKNGDSMWVWYHGIPEDSTLEIWDMAGDTVAKKNIKAGSEHTEIRLKKQLLSGSFAAQIRGKSGKKIPYAEVHQDEFRYDAPAIDIVLSEKKRKQTIKLGTKQQADAPGFTLVFDSVSLDENNKPHAEITAHAVGYRKGYYSVRNGKEVGNFDFDAVPGHTVNVRLKKLDADAETVILTLKLEEKG